MRPTSIAEVARRRAARPDMPLWKPLGEFLDEFYDQPQSAMLDEEPTAPISQEEGAYIAASVEYLCECYGLLAPAWVDRPRFFLAAEYFPESYGPNMEALFRAESPAAFRRRCIFTEERPLRRKMGPRFVR